MLTDLADAVVWTMRMLALTGLCWGAWIVFSHRRLHFERFATFALLVLLVSALGGVVHGG